jgi:predicted DNA-binding transcriptional regulator AlpA
MRPSESHAPPGPGALVSELTKAEPRAPAYVATTERDGQLESGDDARPPSVAGWDLDLDMLMTGREVADLLRLSERTIERHRTAGTGPPYITIGRAVRYRKHDILKFIEQQRRRNTSENVNAGQAVDRRPL